MLKLNHAIRQSRINNKPTAGQILFTAIFLSLLLCCHTPNAEDDITHHAKQGNTTRLIVGNQPFLVLGGELGNSSASSMEYMGTFWSEFTAMNLNTLLIPVYWKLIEKQEGKFDFSLVDRMIDQARKHNLKLVVLWFASWKNNMSSYAPAWVKLDQVRFPRIKDEDGVSHEILTAFENNNLQADRKAFVQLIQHLKEYDKNVSRL